MQAQSQLSKKFIKREFVSLLKPALQQKSSTTSDSGEVKSYRKRQFNSLSANYLNEYKKESEKKGPCHVNLWTGDFLESTMIKKSTTSLLRLNTKSILPRNLLFAQPLQNHQARKVPRMCTVAMYVNAEPHSTSSIIPISRDEVHASKSRILFSWNVHQSTIILNRKFRLRMLLHHEKVSKAAH
ncbi:hypothetical protein Cgig2_001260 [Carnegiea gigantea]|uniref:Uncharacterized protein n=1 Tax=Carnegiea gigantea TaxID=171969 RepID=A0A9Q1GWR7_9CARY|nr:hypothetical protein Cgig2_001260 [Carnegiea gigantea]